MKNVLVLLKDTHWKIEGVSVVLTMLNTDMFPCSEGVPSPFQRDAEKGLNNV